MSKRAEKRAATEIRRVHREDKLADKKMLQRQAADLTEKDAEIEHLRLALAAMTDPTIADIEELQNMAREVLGWPAVKRADR